MGTEQTREPQQPTAEEIIIEADLQRVLTLLDCAGNALHQFRCSSINRLNEDQRSILERTLANVGEVIEDTIEERPFQTTAREVLDGPQVALVKAQAIVSRLTGHKGEAGGD